MLTTQLYEDYFISQYKDQDPYKTDFEAKKHCYRNFQLSENSHVFLGDRSFLDVRISPF